MKSKTVIKREYKAVKIFRKAICAVYPERCPYCMKAVKPLEIACSRCMDNFPKVNFDRRAYGGFPVSCAFPYTEPYDEAIKKMKFKGYKQFAAQMGVKLSEAVKESFPQLPFDFITYVPLHPKRESERGYNQSRLLAKELSYILEIPLMDTLVKIKDNPPQHKTERKHRQKNVKNVYKIIDKKLVSEKRILIVDDIITSGHTLGECGRILMIAGACEIFCATLATAVEKTT